MDKTLVENCPIPMGLTLNEERSKQKDSEECQNAPYQKNSWTVGISVNLKMLFFLRNKKTHLVLVYLNFKLF